MHIFYVGNEDKIIDQQCFLEERGRKPEYVIIGQNEAELLIEQDRQFPMIAGPATQKTTLMGLQVVLDPLASSRVDVVEGFSHATWRRMKRDAEKDDSRNV